MSKITVEVEVSSELFSWFEEYCDDGLLNLDEELAAVVQAYIEQQIEESDEDLEPRVRLLKETDDDEDLDDEDELEEGFYDEAEQ